ncbi:MAG: hypothetical protein QOE61_3325 [Micromonosporaceae bacterium]|nr:hypothetical protein [Micromonosporaceae bacterium]
MTDVNAMDWHLLLLALAGRLSDPVITRGRTRLADGQWDDLGGELVTAILDEAVPLFDLEVDFLGDALAWADGTEERLSRITVTPTGSPLGCQFGVLPPGGRDTAGQAQPADRAAVETAAGLAGAIGLWRSFRTPTGDSPSTRVTRVHVVEADEDADLIAMTAAIQRALEAVGVTDPQVEVYPTGLDMPSYHRLARANGELLWSRGPDPVVQIAVLFDEVDPTHGPRFRPNHPTVDEQEWSKLVDYLRGCEPLLLTTGRLVDVVDRARGKVVPLSYRTDGTWVWSDATTYYLEAHRLQPDPALVAHIRNQSHVPPVVDDVARHRAMAALRRSSAGKRA